MRWMRVHDLPDFVYFNHSVHVAKGVGCATCHGRVDRMPLMLQENTLQMEWCLDCHRNPEKYVRPRDAVFQMDYEAAGQPDRTGPPPGEGIRHPVADVLLDVSQVSAVPQTPEPDGAESSALHMSDDKTIDLGLDSGPARRRPRASSTWQSLEELADSPSFKALVQREFPARPPSGSTRRAVAGSSS